MKNNIKKIKFLMIFILVISSFSMVFAKSRSNGTIDSSLLEDDLYRNQTNGVLAHYIKFMNLDDMLVCEQCLKKYKEGYIEEAWQEMVDMLSHYTKGPQYVAYYMLIEPTTVPYALFSITSDLDILNVTEGTLFGEPLTLADEEKCKKVWKYFLTLYNKDELSNFSVISFTKKTDLENGISISPNENNFSTWMIDISIDLLKDQDLLYKNVASSLVYFHALRKENLDIDTNSNAPAYTAYGRKYKQNSAINQFYKKYWKNIRLEYDQSAIRDYKKDYISEKASRTCHDDFVESFFNYMKKGYIPTDVNNSVVSQKTNFFDEYDEYKLLASRLRAKFGLN